MTLVLSVFVVAALALSLAHFLRAEWYRQQMERQEQEFARVLRELRAGTRPPAA